MLSPVYTKLNKSDAELCRAFRSVINKGKFEIQGEACAKVGAMFKWFSDLDKRIEETIKPSDAPVIKDIE